MSIQPQRSKFKKSTVNYFKDNLLDIIDISETLSKNRYIHKCPFNNFIYAKYIPNFKPIIETEKNVENIKKIDHKENSNYLHNNNKYFEKQFKDLNNDNINFQKLNQNKFHIDFCRLKLEYENDYTILFIDKYYPIEIIGAGGFGLVLSAIDKETNQKLAVKIIDKKNLHMQSDLDAIVYQAKLLKELDNIRIMKIFNILETKKYLFIFMELIEGGNLKDLIINRYIDKSSPYLFRDSECSMIMKGILESLEYLHKNKVIHRDIKPENILFKKKNDLSSVVLCDFGLACQLKEYDKYINHICGTTIYMAPEILSGKKYDFLVDSFSAGIVLYELCSGGMHPFFESYMTKNEYIQKLTNFNEAYSFSKEMPLLARNLFLKLCKYDPNFRYEPFKALKHPWITRSKSSEIPMTILEEYNKIDKIINFKAMLSTSIALIIIKNKYKMKPKIQETDSTFNESIYIKSSQRKEREEKLNKIFNIKPIQLENNFLKTYRKKNYIKASIPLVKTEKISNNLSILLTEKKLPKKKIFPKIEEKSLKILDTNNKTKEKAKLKIFVKQNLEEFYKINLHKYKKRNNSNSYMFLKTYSCERNNKLKNSSKNFSNSHSKSKINNLNKNNKEFRVSDKILKYCDIPKTQENNIFKDNDNDNYFLKNRTHLIVKRNEFKRNKTPNILSLHLRQKKDIFINNVNIKITKNIKNLQIINNKRNNKKKKRFFLKEF
jgi:serine/threonine protein kinase